MCCNKKIKCWFTAHKLFLKLNYTGEPFISQQRTETLWISIFFHIVIKILRTNLIFLFHSFKFPIIENYISHITINKLNYIL